jgi:hypothetical protein
VDQTRRYADIVCRWHLLVDDELIATGPCKRSREIGHRSTAPAACSNNSCQRQRPQNPSHNNTNPILDQQAPSIMPCWMPVSIADEWNHSMTALKTNGKACVSLSRLHRRLPRHWRGTLSPHPFHQLMHDTQLTRGQLRALEPQPLLPGHIR